MNNSVLSIRIHPLLERWSVGALYDREIHENIFLLQMAAKILQQKRIGEHMIYYLDGLDFTNNGVRFRITGSESTGPKPYDVKHTVKNIKTGAFAAIEMQKLIQILLNSE